LSDQDNIQRSARSIIIINGDQAIAHASERIVALTDAGDMDGVRTWRQILDAIIEMQDDKARVSGP